MLTWQGLTFFGVGVGTYEDSQARVRRDIRALKYDGLYGEAEKKRLRWNMQNPDRRIITVKPAPGARYP